MDRTQTKSQAHHCPRLSACGNVIYRIYRFYVDGFRSMTVGRKLWLLIIIKLFILFFIFKLFFFPDILSRDYDTDAERAEAVRESLLSR